MAATMSLSRLWPAMTFTGVFCGGYISCRQDRVSLALGNGRLTNLPSSLPCFGCRRSFARPPKLAGEVYVALVAMHGHCVLHLRLRRPFCDLHFIFARSRVAESALMPVVQVLLAGGP